MVSLVAGLIVTIAVVGLARAATSTFFEAARISSVESAARNASERLRQDLTRVSFMGTGNILLARDQRIAPNPPVPGSMRIGITAFDQATGSRFATFDSLAGIRVIVGGSRSNVDAVLTPGAGSEGPNTLSGTNLLNPDALIVSGNFTTDDAYQGRVVSDTGSSCGGQIVQINGNFDAAARGLIGTTAAPNPNALANMQSAFTPVVGPKYGARGVDGAGCQHFVVVCSVALNGPGIAQIHLDRDRSGAAAIPARSIITNNCGVDGPEYFTISPLQRVAWFIGPNTDPLLDPDPGVEVPGNKFNLYRQMLSAADPPAPIPGTLQIIAEYAVDLKFGLAVADNLDALQIFEMDSDTGGGTGNIDRYGQAANGTVPGGPAPQRIRSVRFRVATRAPIPDRNAPLPVPSAVPYLTRYCTESTLAGCRKFARVRTVVSEVALINQLGMTY
jgi:hypothetical protein